MVVVFAPPTSGDEVVRCSAVLYYPREVICFQWASTCNVHVADKLSPFLWMMMDECRAGGVSVDAARSAETCCSCILVVVRSPTQHSTLYTYTAYSTSTSSSCLSIPQLHPYKVAAWQRSSFGVIAVIALALP